MQWTREDVLSIVFRRDSFAYHNNIIAGTTESDSILGIEMPSFQGPSTDVHTQSGVQVNVNIIILQVQ